MPVIFARIEARWGQMCGEVQSESERGIKYVCGCA